MTVPVFLNREFAHNPLRRRAGPDGQTLPGEFEADGLRLKRADNGWELFVPMRTMQESVYQEFALEDAGGRWLPAGVYQFQVDAQRTAAALASGAKVWRSRYFDLIGEVSASLELREVALAELAQHIAPRGVAS